MRRLLKKIRNTLRYKLLLLVLLPIFLVIPLVLFLAGHWGQRFGYDQLYHKVSIDLSVAHHAFETFKQSNLSTIGALAESYSFRTSFYEGNARSLQLQLDELKKKHNLAFIHITDKSGRWLYEDSPPFKSKPSTLTEQAMQGTPVFGIEIFSRQELQKESALLAQRVELPLLKTPYAVPSDKEKEDRAMMLRMVYPIHDLLVDETVAVIDVGVLINNNFQLVDTIRDLAYGEGSLMKGSIGTVTIFLDDVRISTNVPLGKGERALGTRVSEKVRNHVLNEGYNWVDRAFVVNDWYISSYEPIYNVSGERVGMLYAGFLEAPFREQMTAALQILIGMFVIVMVLAGFWAFLGAKAIFHPVEAMTLVVRDTQQGKESRIGQVSSHDELGELAIQFDTMLDLIHEREEEIRKAGEELEHKVDERTRELQQKNTDLKETIHLLKETREQLVMSKKLAALGELTAGIAHELNNPTAVILGNMEVLMAELGSKLEPVKFEADLVIEQVDRIRSIINNLLQYSRPTEFGGDVENLNINKLMEDTLILVRHLIDKKQIRVKRNFTAMTSVNINRQELQQVIINLLVNAIQAMEKHGELTITTREWDDKGVVIGVRDNGSGIEEQHKDRLFDPFFSTKKSDGTGLGLSVSYGLIRRYGGNISVESTLGEGTLFEIWLLTNPSVDEASQEQAFDKIIEGGLH
ncbi:MAG: cache domain-containing protein [Gammaproteobacteria bacterium]|nr:cache domain-containing protein [Gammaproteobacteria bacterium]